MASNTATQCIEVSLQQLCRNNLTTLGRQKEITFVTKFQNRLGCHHDASLSACGLRWQQEFAWTICHGEKFRQDEHRWVVCGEVEPASWGSGEGCEIKIRKLHHTLRRNKRGLALQSNTTHAFCERHIDLVVRRVHPGV